MKKLTMILGGGRSGKSTYAQNLAMEKSQKVLFIATAEALDDEMAARIKQHRKDRPQHWETLEIPHNVGLFLQKQSVDAEVILLDCLTLLVSNLILKQTLDVDHPDEELIRSQGFEEIDVLNAVIQKSKADWIIVSNEVGLGLIPPYPIGRVYRDLLGSLNQILAAKADEVYFMVAGIPLPLHEHR